MRVLRTTADLHATGMTRGQIRSGAKQGRWRRIIQGVYGAGSHPPSPLDISRATALITRGVAVGALAGVLLEYDGVVLDHRVNVLVLAGCSSGRRSVKRVRALPAGIVEVAQVRCTDGPTTLWDLAAHLTDDGWEQALETACRKHLVTRDEVAAMAARSERRAARVRRVVAARGGLDAPATESLLETLMVQLIRAEPNLPAPERQVNVYNRHGRFVARVDLAWPALGVFIELDGQQHPGQPEYDASRQTAITATTGWLCGRFTWREVTTAPNATRRRLIDLLRQAQLRPITAQ